MNPNFPQDDKRDPEKLLEEFFQMEDLAPNDFSARTLAAVRAKAKRRQILRFSAWSSAAAAASVAFLLGLVLLPTTDESQHLAKNVPEISAESEPVATARVESTTDWTTADELTLALRAAQEGHNVVFYSRALALEDLLADAAALSEEDNEEALDFLTLLAGN